MTMTKSLTFMREFLTFRRFAIVGVSNDPKKYGHIVYHNLKDKGFTVFPVNPNVQQIGDDPCYARLADLPEPVDGAVLVVPPPVTEKIVREAADAGITRVWMQPGAESDEAIQFCEQHGMSVVHDACIMTMT
ncbi:MAG TPA: CoA-binding protein [Phycisphaerae bacterium]|nr:CoA-binding protein [Phycisphaerae bacterium]HOJ72308.1 CoA-binding protein [Phycisphaerae bacterium]HOM50030.1 CoA-binding protein [Phycisphaerae bacterium]HON67257.1 CoA-binding protein [Phycisphaerae bacterium]HOQ85732.1 CoA-binding protein [Phycisphaerae bacterium]